MAAGFLIFFLSLIVLLIVLWADHRERTDAGRFKGFTLDAHQRAYLKAYFSSRRGRSHGLVMVACLGLYFGDDGYLDDRLRRPVGELPSGPSAASAFVVHTTDL